MKNVYLPAVVLAMSALVGCNDGSGFISTKETSTSIVETNSDALRNMATDQGNTIVAPDIQSPDGEQVSNLIDGAHETKFLAFSPDAQFTFKASKPYVLKRYHLISANDAPPRDPKTWVLEGSNDGERWDLLDEQFDNSFSARAELKAFQLNNNEEAYQYYRFTMKNSGIDEWGQNLLQLAELELFVVAEKPIVAFSATNTTPKIDEIVIFNDTSLVNPTSWYWTFEGGAPATSTEANPLVRFNELGPKSVTLVATNDKGSSELIKDDFIRVWDPQNPWHGFTSPSVTFTKNKPDHQGQAVLERVMPDFEAEIHRISEAIAKRLFNNVTEINIFESVNVITDEYEFPAAKSGSDKNMILMFDLNHILNLELQSDQAIRDEIIGMLWHELTHGYNNVPNSGIYTPGNELHTYLEALANFIRIEAGYLEHARANIDWIDDINQDAYNQTAFFLEWVVKTHRNIDFIKQFNAAAKQLPTWSFDGAFKLILGDARGLDIVFAEYQEYLISLGKVPSYPMPEAEHINILQFEDVQVTTNATHLSLFGEGIDKLIDNNIRQRFTAVIEEPWWMAQYAPDLLPIKQVDSVLTDITLTNPHTITKYSIVQAHEQAVRFPTSWQMFGSNDGDTWELLDEQTFTELPQLVKTYTYELAAPASVKFVRFSFLNEREGQGIGGDNGRFIQLGEIALLTPSNN